MKLENESKGSCRNTLATLSLIEKTLCGGGIWSVIPLRSRKLMFSGGKSAGQALEAGVLPLFPVTLLCDMSLYPLVSSFFLLCPTKSTAFPARLPHTAQKEEELELV